MELIKIVEVEGNKAISARDLYNFLSVDDGSHFSDWGKRNIEELFTQNIDYQTLRYVSENGGRPGIDYALTIDTAKNISMMSRCEKGMQARQYFIECEKKLKKPMTQIELILQSAQILADMDRKQTALESRIEAIENRPAINAPIEHFSVMGYCHSIGRKISLDEAKSFSLKCKKMCVDMGMTIGKVPDARYGAVNTYPSDVLCQIIGA